MVKNGSKFLFAGKGKTYQNTVFGPIFENSGLLVNSLSHARDIGLGLTSFSRFFAKMPKTVKTRFAKIRHFLGVRSKGQITNFRDLKILTKMKILEKIFHF